MKITGISSQIKNPNRLNISVDGKYRFSLDLMQVVDLGIKIGREVTEEELSEFEEEGSFSRLYARALEYTLMRPHSSREIRDYLRRKTRASKYKTRKGEIKEREGVSEQLTTRVFDRLSEKGHVNDEVFTRWWVESRHQLKGTSSRKLTAELRAKGVEQGIIEQALTNTERNDEDELAKIILKKRARYTDDQKFMMYLARQGFSYDDIKRALNDSSDQ